MPSAISQPSIFQRIAVLFYILILAWAPFPLGSAVAWGAGLLQVLVAACWMIWILANVRDLSIVLPNKPALWVAASLYLIAVFWAFLQSFPVLPDAWAHPIWEMMG